MSISERAETVARSMLRTVEQTLGHGGSKAKKTALETLHSYLDKSARAWSPAVDECFALLVRIAAEQADSGSPAATMYIKSAILSQRNRVLQLSVNHMRDAVAICLKAGQGIVDRALAKARNTTDVAPEERIFRVMTGATAEERGKQCFLDPAFHQYMEIVKAVLQAMDRVAKFEPLIQESCRTAITLAALHGRSYELGIFQGLLKTHLRELLAAEGPYGVQQRDGVINSAETLTSIIQTKQEQTRVAREMRDWSGAVGVMREVRGLIAQLRKVERFLKVSDQCPVWELEAEVLFAAGNAPFHAFQACNVARRRIFDLGVDAETAKQLASQAVLAVLCVPDSQLSTSDANGDRLLHLAKTLSMTSPPTRESLLADIERQSQTGAGGVSTLLGHSIPAVRELYQLFCSTPTIEICKLAAPLLKQISAITTTTGGAAAAAGAVAPVSLARYVPSLEGVALRNMLGIMSRCFSSVAVDDFIARCGGILCDSDVAARIEPLVREKFGQGVQIIVDFGARRIFFKPSAIAAENLISFQSSLAAHIADVTRPCYGAAASASTSTSVAAAKPATTAATVKPADKAEAAKKVTALLSRIDDARTRTQARYVVCKARIDNFAARLSALDEADRKRRAEDLVIRADKEGERVSAKRKQAEIELQKTVAQEEAAERRKWVVSTINNKHKGLNMPATLATTVPPAEGSKASSSSSNKKMDDNQFLFAASNHLLGYLRRMDASRSSDVKTMEHWERACREVEIPLRKQLFAEQTAAAAESAKIQAENRRKLHQRAFEEALVMKKKLERLMPQKEQYEREVQASIKRQQEKNTSKHDKQDDDLDAFMRARDAKK